MLFRSRETPTLRQRLRRLVWPRTSFSRSARYVWKRLFRLKASPHKIAVGAAAGVFASITPLIGVQMVMAGAIALILRGSLAAAMLATFFGNPLSWPIIWGATYGLGSLMVGSPGAAEAASLATGDSRLWSVVYTMLIGSIPIGLVSAAVSYGITARAVEAVRAGRVGPGTFQLIPADVGVRLRSHLVAAERRLIATMRLASQRVTNNWITWREPSWRLW